jgi:hypothetical protein
MLYFTLVLAAVIVLAALFAARPAPQRVRWDLFVPIALVPVGVHCLTASLIRLPVLVYLSGFLLVGLLLWSRLRTRKGMRRFWPVALVAVLGAYGHASWIAYGDLRAENRVREKYAFVSLVGRVPEPRRDDRLADPDNVGWFKNHELYLQGSSSRADRLQRLHKRTTEAFVNSDGFGIVRMMHPMSDAHVMPMERPEVPLQPGPPVVWTHGEKFDVLPKAERYSDRARFAGVHVSGLTDFTFSDGWGYLKDRDRVAGFFSHRFSKVPTTSEWTVHRIELVGLLKHAEPKVYLSDKLPAMDDLRDAPTRPLDAFETAGLAAIRKGEEGFAAQRPDVVRYMGAIRSAKQCAECHGGQRGDLLGAFAYTLRR